MKKMTVDQAVFWVCMLAGVIGLMAPWGGV